MTQIKKGRCHCGAVEYEVTLEKGITPVRCNCSLCRRKGAMISFVPLAGLRLIKGEESLTLYQWNTKVAKHWFCKHCGIYTHHQRRSDPNFYGFNLGCIEGLDTFALGEAHTFNGSAMSLV